MLRIEKDAGVYPSDTICEKHRQIFDILVLEVKDQNPDLYGRLSVLLDQAFGMAKRMGGKLMEYNGQGRELWSPHEDVEAVKTTRLKRIKKLEVDK